MDQPEPVMYVCEYVPYAPTVNSLRKVLTMDPHDERDMKWVRLTHSLQGD